jgi:hypothetical protein
MNNHDATLIDTIQGILSDKQQLADIKAEIGKLINKIEDTQRQKQKPRPSSADYIETLKANLISEAGDNYINIKSSAVMVDSDRRDKLPDALRATLVAIGISNSYIEIFSNGTIRLLEEVVPGLKGSQIAAIMHAQMKSKCQKLAVEKEKCLTYKPVCRRVRQDIVKLNDPISKPASAETLRNLIWVPQHAFAIASFQSSRVVFGTIGIHACIGLAVVNPRKKLVAITHLDRPTIETYKSSLQAIFKKVFTDEKDKCQIYLIGGANEPKEASKETSVGYQASLGSETLACSIMDFLRDYPKGELRADMFYEKRPDGFAIQVDPNMPREIFTISDKDAEALEDRHDIELYQRQMMADAIFYEELQECYFANLRKQNVK